MKKFIKYFFVSLLFLPFLFSNVSAKDFKIYYVVHGGITHPAWLANKAGVDDAAAMLDDASVTYIGPETYKLEEFVNYVQTAVDANPDAIVVTMTAPDAMTPVLQPFADKGGVIVEINTGQACPESLNCLTYVGYDPYESGVNAANKAFEMAKARGITLKETLYPNHAPGAVHIEEWGRGFMEQSEKLGMKTGQVDVTASEYTGADIIVAYKKKNPDVDFIYNISIPQVQTVLTRFEEEGITGVYQGTFDFTTDMVKEIAKDDSVWFTQDQQMYIQGFQGTMAAYLNLKHQFILPPAITTIGFTTPENALDMLASVEAGVR
jgi:ABC-type sugar transport system substrate-binding protein|tara:strand:+ start:204 stop:1166 length:963 start_codon:yes stop_codon:yes gene_type:complete